MKQIRLTGRSKKFERGGKQLLPFFYFTRQFSVQCYVWIIVLRDRVILMQFVNIKAALAAAIFLQTAVPAYAAKQPLLLAPSSKWVVNYGDDRCQLARSFGIDDLKVVLSIEQFGPDDSFRLSLSGKPVKFSSTDGDVSIRFGPTEAAQKMSYFSGNSGDGSPAIIIKSNMRIAPFTAEEARLIKESRKALGTVEFAPITPEREKAVNKVEIGKPLSPNLVLQTGSMGPVFETMRKCNDDLVRTWGVDPDQFAKQTKAVVPLTSPGRWVVSTDYPAEALRKGKRAIVNFRLSVDTAGKPTDCKIQRSTNAEDFDKVVCSAILRRAKFEPALDEQGQPMASFYRNTVVFETGY